MSAGTGVYVPSIVFLVVGSGVVARVSAEPMEPSVGTGTAASLTPKIDRSPSHSLILKIVKSVCVSILRAGP